MRNHTVAVLVNDLRFYTLPGTWPGRSGHGSEKREYLSTYWFQSNWADPEGAERDSEFTATGSLTRLGGLKRQYSTTAP